MEAVVLRFEAVTEPESGIWCDGCALPSIVRVLVAVLSQDRIIHIGPYERCYGNCPDENILVEGN